jgi:cephalosporin hydroxylase
VHRFFPLVVRPLLEIVEPEIVLEVGAKEGGHSKRLAEWCREHGATLHVIEPAPQFDPDSLGPGVLLHRDLSLQVLPGLPPVDVALIDGDHNWFTVINELRLLARATSAAARPMPLVLCHDVCWPYGRRDLYYDPQTIPAEYRRSWECAGIVPGRASLAPRAGLNPHLCNATEEGGPRNGVMTAIEDFIEEAADEIELTVLPVLHGLAILAPRSRLEASPPLRAALERWETVEGWRDLARLAEEELVATLTREQALIRRVAAGAKPSLRDPRGLLVAAARRLTSPLPHRRAPVTAGRRFASSVPPGTLAEIQAGALRTTYRGLPFLKSPFDIGLYLQLIGQLQPRTVIEIGTKAGGSALWFSDQLRAHGIDGRVLSVDLEPPAAVDDERVDFIRGDARDLGTALPQSLLTALPGPRLVIEDSAHSFETTLAVLEFFHRLLAPGDYVVVEDGIVSDLPGRRYRKYEDGPNPAVKHFLEKYPAAYAIDAELCDHYGYNATWSPNGWLRRVDDEE